jgi:hypothetical protein
MNLILNFALCILHCALANAVGELSDPFDLNFAYIAGA